MISYTSCITAGGEPFRGDNWMVGVDWAWGNFRYSSWSRSRIKQSLDKSNSGVCIVSFGCNCKYSSNCRDNSRLLTI